MPQPAIRIERLGKAFRRATAPVATRIVDEVAGWLHGRRRSADEEFWALRDADLEIAPGDVIGLIGHNGAGKSTLLKLLCRILHPTTGRIELHGRIGSLLEVGTGFHPELTGRENIFLNGAILGMSRREIAARFDEIVAFSEVEAFLDTPIKHYSSGMTVRLAFAVAAHLDPEILLVDEVLAVGDVGFQKKCLGRLRDLSQNSGRTVILVSHNPAALATLCQRGIVLEHGRVAFDGDIQSALERYVTPPGESLSTEWTGRSGDDDLQLVRTWVAPQGADVWDTGVPLEIGATIDVLKPVEGLILGVRVFSQFGAELIYLQYDDLETDLAPIVEPGRMTQRWTIPANTLAAGEYRTGIELGLAYKRVSHKDPQGELRFRLENLTGCSRRYPVADARGYTSLLRPAWPAQTHREPLLHDAD